MRFPKGFLTPGTNCIIGQLLTAAGRRDEARTRIDARHQDAPLFELRSALDDFEIRGEDARDVLVEAVNRFSVERELFNPAGRRQSKPRLVSTK